MNHELDLILTLTGALAAALVLGFGAQKIGLSPIVGYLAAGVAVGPFTPGFVAHAGIASQFAELGVILIMFGVGLNLHVKELLAVRRVALPGALLAMSAAAGAGFGLARALGWSATAGVYFGLALAATSTVVLLRVFADRNLMSSQPGHIAIGWLLVEDLAVVLAVVLVPVITGGGGAGGGLAAAIALAVAKIVGLVVLTLAGGRFVVPRVLGFIARTRSRELFTLSVLVLALGVAVAAAKLFGASMALGAFLAGLVVGQSEFGARAGSEALPMRDAFAVLFFVATGMLLDPAELLPNARPILLTLALVLVTKPLVALIFVRVLGYPLRTALALALGLGQIGEFSFMIAALGTGLGVLPTAATQVLVAVAMVTITLNPILVRLVDPVARRWGARPEGEPPAPEADDPRFRALVVGYGPVGKSLVALLRENGVSVTVLELDHDVVAKLRAEGIPAVHGDSSQRAILEHAGIGRATSLLFTSSAPALATIHQARDMAPDLRILTRAAYQREVPALEGAGASAVVSAEVEVALAMAERVLSALGATDEQLDRARDRVRREVDKRP